MQPSFQVESHQSKTSVRYGRSDNFQRRTLGTTRETDFIHIGRSTRALPSSLGTQRKGILMTAICPNCETAFRGVDRNEDGSPAIETIRCAHPGCEVYLCQAGCEHLSFTCEACGGRFCLEHKVILDYLELCIRCALESVESQEPECACSQSDVDVFDARGCPLHDGNSSWNSRLRALTLIREYEAATQSAKRTRARDRELEVPSLAARLAYEAQPFASCVNALAELEGAHRHAFAHQPSIRTRTYRGCGGNDASSQTRHRHGQEDVMKQEQGEAMKEVVKFPINTPVEVTLQAEQGNGSRAATASR